MGEKVPHNEAYTFHCHFLKKDCDFVTNGVGVHVVSCPVGAIEIYEKNDGKPN